MSLSDFTPATDTVRFQGGSFTVRGLSLNDVSVLVRLHLADLERFVGYFQDAMKGPEAGDPYARLVLSLAQDMPLLVSHVIAIAANEPDNIEAVTRLPFPVTVDALLKIGRLTFEDVGGPENFAKALAGLVAGVLPAKLPEKTAGASSTTTEPSAKG